MFNYLREDLKRYRDRGHFAWYEPSLLSIFCYRWGQTLNRLWLPLRFIGTIFFIPVNMLVTLITGIHLPRGAKIGGGLRIHHFGCIVLNPAVRIGRNCTIRHEVTIGNRCSEDDVPVIGDDVNIGAGAKILGAITIGNRVQIGANAVVLQDIPDDATAVGVPARIITGKGR